MLAVLLIDVPDCDLLEDDRNAIEKVPSNVGVEESEND